MKLKTPNKRSFGTPGVSKKPSGSAKSKAVALLARREHSQSELRTKLTQRGYDSKEIDEAIQWATAHQFQSDDRFKLSLFRRRAPTFGDRAISSELGQHGLGDVKSMEVEESIKDTILSEEDRAYDWIKRRQYTGLEAVFNATTGVDQGLLLNLKSKVYRGLSSRGFEFGSIERAWRRILSEY